MRAGSRKPGMSKTALGDALGAVGVEYRHEPSLGNPPDNRDGYRQGRRSARIAFRRHAEDAGSGALDRVAAAALSGRVALLCYEADQGCCHRGEVIAAVRARNRRVSPERDISAWDGLLAARLKELSALREPGWDGQWAHPMDKRSVGMAWDAGRAVCAAVAECPDPLLEPTTEGGVDISWEDGERAVRGDIDLCIHPEGCSVRVNTPTGRISHTGLACESDVAEFDSPADAVGAVIDALGARYRRA